MPAGTVPADFGLKPEDCFGFVGGEDDGHRSRTASPPPEEVERGRTPSPPPRGELGLTTVYRAPEVPAGTITVHDRRDGFNSGTTDGHDQPYNSNSRAERMASFAFGLMDRFERMDKVAST